MDLNIKKVEILTADKAKTLEYKINDFFRSLDRQYVWKLIDVKIEYANFALVAMIIYSYDMTIGETESD